jgi:hypothetical protein
MTAFWVVAGAWVAWLVVVFLAVAHLTAWSFS